MESNNRTFIASSAVFNGFTSTIDLNYCDSIYDIINIFKRNLLQVLERYNFEELIIKLNKLNFHIHTYSFEDILLNNTTFYICDSNHLTPFP